MASKDLKPKTRLGNPIPGGSRSSPGSSGSRCAAAACSRHTAIPGSTEVEVAVARVRRADFVISVRTRGDIRSARSTILKAPSVPGLRIVHLADNGRPIKKGEMVVEFDAAQQESNVISRTTAVRAADGDIEQVHANQVMVEDSDVHEQDDFGVWRGIGQAGCQQGRGPLGGGRRKRTASRWACRRARCSR